MKKTFKKLALHRETLAELDRTELGQAAGGTGYATCTCYPDRCEYSANRNTCTTCNLTCTSNWC